MSAPERIWLQDGGDYELAKEAMSDLTWRSEPINDADTEYVRADLYNVILARAERLAALLDEAVEALRDAGSALDYIRYHYGELYGVGFDRVRDKHGTTLAKIKETQNG